MNCRTIRKRLSAYEDQELSPDEQARIRSHLQDCPQCRERFAMFQYTREILEELPDVQPAPGFYLAVSKKIFASHDRRLRARLRQVFQFFPSPLAMTACLVIGLLAGAYLANSLALELFNSPRSTAVISTPGEPLLASLRSFDAIAPGTLASGYVRMVRTLPEGEDAQ
jgi:anti-sigma factor RsiW